MECELRVFESSAKIKACFMSAKGMVAVVVQVIKFSSTLVFNSILILILDRFPPMKVRLMKSGDFLSEMDLNYWQFLKFFSVDLTYLVKTFSHLMLLQMYSFLEQFLIKLEYSSV